MDRELARIVDGFVPTSDEAALEQFSGELRRAFPNRALRDDPQLRSEFATALARQIAEKQRRYFDQQPVYINANEANLFRTLLATGFKLLDGEKKYMVECHKGFVPDSEIRQRWIDGDEAEAKKGIGWLYGLVIAFQATHEAPDSEPLTPALDALADVAFKRQVMPDKYPLIMRLLESWPNSPEERAYEGFSGFDGFCSRPDIRQHMQMADRMFLMVPAQTAVAKKLKTLKEFPPSRFY